jgi:RNA polymerase sigma-70 factor, ECF subfamily
MDHGAQSDQRIHQRLLAGDPTASEEVAARHLDPVRRHVRARAFRHGITDNDLINDAAVDAVFEYIRHPEKFDPSKSRLIGYLKRAAERDLINAVQKNRRHRRGEVLMGDVELSILAGNKSSDIERIRHEGESQVLSSMEVGPSSESILRHVTDQTDRALLEMMIRGERHTGSFAAVLGISNLPVSQQRRIVKQHKDRLKQQLKRARGKHRA